MISSRTILIVDHAIYAEGLALLIQNHLAGQQHTILTATTLNHQPPADAVVLIELALPNDQCGLLLAQQLQQHRPDLTPIVWTSCPTPFYIWAAMEYKLPGFLDKTLSVPDLCYWLNHVLSNGVAWPRYLLPQAHTWSKIAAQIRGLSSNLWILWIGLLHGSSNLELAARLGWSRRTIERRLTELYTILGVQSRSEAVTMAWKWNLIKTQNSELKWAEVAVDLFGIPECPTPAPIELELELNVH